MRFLPFIFVLVLSPAFAAEPSQALEPLSYGKAVNVIVSLVMVLGVLFACAWLMRRGRSVMGQGGQKIAVTSQLPISVREKIILLRVGDENVLVGYAGGTLRTLHSWSGDVPPDIDAPQHAAPFADTMSRLMNKTGGNK